MSDNGTPLAPPGWYDDPSDGAGLRYWDGRHWTEHHTGRPPAAHAGAPVTVGTPAPAQTTSGMPWWGWLIVAVIGLWVVLVVLVSFAWQFTGSEVGQVSEERVEEPEPTTGEPGYGDFGPGVHVVGEDIDAGTYRMLQPLVEGGFIASCYWVISPEPDGSAPRDNLSLPITGGRSTVTVVDGDVLEVAECGNWERIDPSTLFDNEDAVAFIGEGFWLVGEDIAPGTYRTDQPVEDVPGIGLCVWSTGEDVDQNFRANVEDGGASEGHLTVTVEVGQQFITRGCGSWSPVDASGPDSVEAGHVGLSSR